MRKDRISKYALRTIPYIFIFWFCLKFGTAYRLAPGVLAGEKLIRAFAGIGPACRTIAPGLIGFDWLIGMMGIVPSEYQLNGRPYSLSGNASSIV